MGAVGLGAAVPGPMGTRVELSYVYNLTTRKGKPQFGLSIDPL